jgi:hypothetical protein
MADPETLKRALKAFKKRLKLTKQDDESRLGHSAMTKGETSAIVGIRPPGEFPPEVWEELVQQGILRYEGHGLYALPEDMGARG